MIKLNRLIITNLYVNLNVKKESEQYFRTSKNGKMDKNYGIEEVYIYTKQSFALLFGLRRDKIKN